MRAGMPASIGLHLLVLGAFVLPLLWPSRKEPEPIFIDAVDGSLIEEVTQLKAGKKDAPPPKDAVVPRDTEVAPKETDGERAGTKAVEDPPPPPPQSKPEPPKPEPVKVAVAPPVEKLEPPKPPEATPEPPKPEPPKPEPPKPEPRKIEAPPPTPAPKPPEAKPTPPKAEPVKTAEAPKPEKPVEAEKAQETGEGAPPETKAVDAKDKAELEKLMTEPKKPEPKAEPKKADAPKPSAPAKPATPAKTRVAAATPRTTGTTPAKFDPNAILRSIQSRDPTGTAAAPERRTATLGSERTTVSAPALTMSELDSLRQQVLRCMFWPPGTGEAQVLVKIDMQLNADGSLVARPAILEASAHPKGPALAQAALRAVIQCAPYRLPAGKYETWKHIQPSFDLSDQQ